MSTTAPDPLKEAAGVALSIASELTSVVYAIQNLQLRLVTIPKHQGGRALEKPSTGPDLRAQEAADRLRWQPALNDRWLAAAGPVDTTKAWAAALPWATRDRGAARAVTRCEARLTVINPDAMARYQELRLKGLDRADAMVETAPLFDAQPGRPQEPGVNGADVAASVRASAAAADEVVDALEAQHDRPAPPTEGTESDDLSLEALDRTARQPALHDGRTAVEEARPTEAAAREPGPVDLDAEATRREGPGAAGPFDWSTERVDERPRTVPGPEAAVPDQADLTRTAGPTTAPDTSAATLTAPAAPDVAAAPAEAQRSAGPEAMTTDATPDRGVTPPAGPADPAPATEAGLTADAATASIGDGAPPAGPPATDAAVNEVAPGLESAAERDPAPAASATSGVMGGSDWTEAAEETNRVTRQGGPADGTRSTEGVSQTVAASPVWPTPVVDLTAEAPTMSATWPEAVPGSPVTDRAAETLAQQELGRAAADRSQPDIVRTAADEHTIGVEQAERHAHTADTLHAAGTAPAPGPRPPADAPPAKRTVDPSEAPIAGPLNEAINRPPRPKPGPGPGGGPERGKGRSLGGH